VGSRKQIRNNERKTRGALLSYHEVQMMDASTQLVLTISVPTFTVLIGILINNSRISDVKSRLSDVNSRISELRADMNTRFDESNAMMDRRFADMKDMWRSELHRVEEVLDARLKHLEER
jgi:outer membrane murein-binding lipoprotein Lpp